MLSISKAGRGGLLRGVILWFAPLSVLCLTALDCATVTPRPAHLSTSTSTNRSSLTAALGAAEELVERSYRSSAVPIPGLAVGIVIGSQVVWAQGYGLERQGGAPIDGRSVFRIGSITKVFTGLALLKLREMGKLDLDEPLSKYLPEAAGLVPPTRDASPLLLRHLVTHTSGLPRDVGLAEPVSETQLRASLDGLKLDFTPGSDFGYSNLAMALCGLVIEAASGTSYRAFIEERILGPLQMIDSGWDRKRFAGGRLTTGYHFDPHSKTAVAALTEVTAGANEAAGGLFSTVNDLGKFLSFELEAWPPNDSPDRGALSRAAVRESQRISGPSVPGGSPVGVNWILKSSTELGYIAWHNGSIGDGYASWIGFAPLRGVGAIVLLNLDGEAQVRWAGDLGEKILRIVGEALTEIPAVSVDRSSLLPVVEAITAAVNDPVQFRPEGLFSEAFLRSGSATSLETMVVTLHERLGVCQAGPLTAVHASSAKVALTCERGALDLDFELAAAEPRLITSFRVREHALPK